MNQEIADSVARGLEALYPLYLADVRPVLIDRLAVDDPHGAMTPELDAMLDVAEADIVKVLSEGSDERKSMFWWWHCHEAQKSGLTPLGQFWLDCGGHQNLLTSEEVLESLRLAVGIAMAKDGYGLLDYTYDLLRNRPFDSPKAHIQAVWTWELVARWMWALQIEDTRDLTSARTTPGSPAR